MNNLKAPETNFPTPPPKIRPRIVERIAEFGEHVQRHEQIEDVLAASIVNQGFDGKQRAAPRQGIVGRAGEFTADFRDCVNPRPPGPLPFGCPVLSYWNSLELLFSSMNRNFFARFS